MPKKKSEHYVNNKEFLEALVVYRCKVERNFTELNGREPTKEDSPNLVQKRFSYRKYTSCLCSIHR